MPFDLADLAPLVDPTRRRPLLARRGAVATSQPLAAAAGVQVLRDGGSAVDAAIAVAACLTVVEPCSNGLGSDAFAQVWHEGELHGLNGSGRAPAELNAEPLRAQGLGEIPERGWASVTVPGAVRAWVDLHERFGRLDFARLLAPAIEAAAHGFLVTPVIAASWRQCAQQVQPGLTGPEHAAWPEEFAPAGRAPRAGELWRNPNQAATLRLLAETAGEALYTGDLATRLVRFSDRTGGYFTADDLANHRSTWVTPISASYRGYDVWEIPPSGQGIAALMAMRILDGFNPPTDPDDPSWWHQEIEAVKLALSDVQAHVGDPDHMLVGTGQLLDPGYTRRRRALIGQHALHPLAGRPAASDTVLLVTADTDGQMVSFIQSNYNHFGSHIVVPGTGICLQNRGAGFNLTPGHPNELGGGKRPFHTIIPGFLTHDGEPIGPFGVMGAHMQPQGHVQVLSHTLDGFDDPQTALDRPRWYWTSGREVQVEPATPPEVVAELARRGHRVSVGTNAASFGRGQIIWRLADGYVVGSESRADGLPVGY